MAYATVANVQILLPEFVINGTSVPTDSQVTTLISWLEARINANLAYCGYDTPVDDADDILRLQDIVSKAIASEAWKIHFVGRNLIQRILAFDQEVMEFMAMLEKCQVKLPSGPAPEASGQVTAGTITLGSFIYDD